VLVAGLVLLAVAIGAIVFSRLEAKKAHTARATETLACGDVAALSKGVADEVGGGMFTQRCESVGAAQPGPHGLVDAPESKVDAVWVRTKVVHKYWEMVETTRDGRTHRDRQEREETVSDNTSSAPFVLTDDTGSVAIHPDGAEIDRPEKVVDRFEQRSQVEQGGGGLLATLLRSTNDSGTLGFQHQEWVIRPGARLYVQGEVADRSGALVFAKPQDKGAFLVSTRSEEEIVAHADRNAKLAQYGGIAAAVVGVVLVIAGAVA
jgi:hypothetical protein